MGFRWIIGVICLFSVAACAERVPEINTINGVPLLTAAQVPVIQTSHVDGLNAYRASRGLGQVQLSSGLNAAAATHARDMSVQRRAWHFGSDGTSPADRAARAGFAGRVLGENISESYDTDIQVLQSWINDPLTSRVMLLPAADRVGFAFFQDPDGKLWWVQMIGQSGVAPDSLSPNPFALGPLTRALTGPLSDLDLSGFDLSDLDLTGLQPG